MASRHWAGAILAVGLAPTAYAQAPAQPAAGFSLGITLGGGWHSNPLEITGRHKGDIYSGGEIVAGYRWALAEIEPRSP